MTARSAASRLLPYFAIAAVLMILAGTYGVRWYRITRTAHFCAAVADLPPGELEGLASTCDRLMWDRGGPEAELQFIRETDVLSQFSLIGREPYEIVVEKGVVALKFFDGDWRYSDLLLWKEDFAPDGERVRTLKITYGDGVWQTLFQREGPHGEPGAAPELPSAAPVLDGADNMNTKPQSEAPADGGGR